MVLVKNRVKYFYYILSIKAAYCNPFCKRFIRGSCIYYSKIVRTRQAYFFIFSIKICPLCQNSKTARKAQRNTPYLLLFKKASLRFCTFSFRLL